MWGGGGEIAENLHNHSNFMLYSGRQLLDMDVYLRTVYQLK